MGLLPTEKSKPKTSLSDYTFFLYSAPKHGKSTFAAQFPNAVFLATEPGLNALSCYKVDVPTWDVFLAACAELAAGGHGFRSVAVDTVDSALNLCRQHILERYHAEHEADQAYGRLYALIQAEFQRVMSKIGMMGLGVIFISHAEVQEIAGRTGTVHKIVPSLKDKARKSLLAQSDMIFYGDIEVIPGPNGEKALRRVWRTKPHPNYEAGDRTGRLPDPLPLDFDIFKAEFDRAVAAHAASLGSGGAATRSDAQPPVSAATPAAAPATANKSAAPAASSSAKSQTARKEA